MNIDDLKKIKGIKESNEKAKELCKRIQKDSSVKSKCYEIDKMYKIGSEEFSFGFYKDHYEYINDKIENDFVKTIENNKKKRKKESKHKFYKPENWIAKFAVKESIIKDKSFKIGTFFDYEVPTEKGEKTNIDLLSYDKKTNILRIVELKKEGSGEYFKAIIELVYYFIRAKGYDFKNCELKKHPYLERKSIKQIKMSILTHKNSKIVRYYKKEYDKYPGIKSFLDLFEIEFFVYTTKKHGNSDEEIIIDKIEKLD